jgi:hypothetical protein
MTTSTRPSPPKSRLPGAEKPASGVRCCALTRSGITASPEHRQPRGKDRIAEAKERGWLGEVEGLEVSRAAARRSSTRCGAACHAPS